MIASPFLTRLASGRVLLLDGATGTELQRRGVDTGLPLWSARALIEAPEVLTAIHADYVAAGADIITTNTFRTHRRTLTRAGMGERTRELIARSSSPDPFRHWRIVIPRSWCRPTASCGSSMPRWHSIWRRLAAICFWSKR